MIGAVVMVACISMMIWMMSHGGSGHGGPGDHGDGTSNRSARDILAERFARGEISEQEFEERRRGLEHRPS